jgi:phospholipase/lecithinase/hemolysin
MATIPELGLSSINLSTLGLGDLSFGQIVQDTNDLISSVGTDLKARLAPVGGIGAGAEALRRVLPAVNTPAAPPGSKYSAIYAFGDSLSDSGNVRAATGGTTPASPYFDGRFSNGPVWVEDLATHLGLAAPKPSLTGGTDFAYGGAESGTTSVHGETPIDLSGQLLQFKAQVTTPDPNALYTVWAGSNDIMAAISEAGSDPAKAQQAVSQTVNNISQFISSLANLGVKHLLVMDVPDLGTIPAKRGGGSAEASAFARQFNVALGTEINTLAQGQQLDINLFDTYGLIDSAVTNPGRYALTNVTDPVWTGGFTPGSSGTLNASGAAQNQFLFFDKMHPTAQAHAILADAALQILAAPVDVVLRGTHDQYVVALNPAGGAVIQDSVPGRDGTQTPARALHIVFTDGIGWFDATGNAGEVARLYKAAFNRAADAGGLDYWTGQLDNHTLQLPDISRSFIGSAEANTLYGSLSNQRFVEQLYQNVLGRPGESSGIQYWTGALDAGASRAQELVGFSDSIENKTKTVSTIDDQSWGETYRLYQAAFDRTPDTSGLNYWIAELDAGTTVQQVAHSLVSSTEFTGNYAGLDSTGYVAKLYQNVLHRSGDASGTQYWVAQLNGGTSLAQVLVGFSDSLENRTATASATHDNWVFLSK